MESAFYTLLDETPNIKRYAFENNWPYILQATRNGLLVFNDTNVRVYYTKRTTGDPSSTTVVVNGLGKRRKEGINTLAAQEKENGVTTVVKNVDKEELDWWILHGFVESSKPWSPYSFRDDNSYPQYLLYRNDIIMNNFGKDIRWHIKKFDTTRRIITEPYSAKYDVSARTLLTDFSIYSEKKGNDSATEIQRAHIFFFDKTIRVKIRLQHTENDQLIGFSFLTPVGGTIFYNLLICQHEDNLYGGR